MWRSKHRQSNELVSSLSNTNTHTYRSPHLKTYILIVQRSMAMVDNVIHVFSIKIFLPKPQFSERKATN